MYTMGSNHELFAAKSQRASRSVSPEIPVTGSANNSVSLLSYRADSGIDVTLDSCATSTPSSGRSEKHGETNFAFAASESDNGEVTVGSDKPIHTPSTCFLPSLMEQESETTRRNCLKTMRLRLIKDTDSEKIREDSLVKALSQDVRT